MLQEKSPIKYREIIIVGLVGLILLILGFVFDFNLTSNVYDPVNTNLLGVILAGFSELPVCFALAFSGSILIIHRPKEAKKALQILSIVVGVIAIGFSLYYTYDTWQEYTTFAMNAGKDTVFKITGIIFSLLFNAIVVLFVLFFTKKFDKRNMLYLAIFFLIFVAAVSIVTTGAKYLWSRPRPRYIFVQDGDPLSLFKNAWELNPFYAFKEKECKSFPSGHSAYATIGMFVFPLLTLLSEKTKEDRKLQIILFYVGFLWALITMFSRILAGAHFLSDVAAGFLFTSLLGFISLFVLFKKIELV